MMYRLRIMLRSVGLSAARSISMSNSRAIRSCPAISVSRPRTRVSTRAAIRSSAASVILWVANLASSAQYKLVSYSITNPLNYAGIYGLTHVLGAAKVWSYYDALAPVTKTFDDGLTALAYMLQGGASLGYMTSGLAQGVLPHYKGLASYTFMQDATRLIPRGITVPRNAASPASARLFLDFLYTQAGQAALCAGGFPATMNNFHSANGCTASLTALQSHVPPNTIYLVPINQAVLSQQSAITKRWNQTFHR